MCSIKKIIESTGLKAERGIYTGEEKPAAYCTFIRLIKDAGIRADDKESESREKYRVSLFCKGNFEKYIERLIEVFEEAGFYINDVGTEYYETETGYWLVPITLEILKE